jgi:hypothetical protein
MDRAAEVTCPFRSYESLVPAEALAYHFDPTLKAPEPAANLRGAIVLMRHGDRTPIHSRLGSLDLGHLAPLWETLLPTPAMRSAMDAFALSRKASGSGPNSHAAFLGSPPFGQLTARGAVQCHAIGVEMKRRYPPTWRVEVRSTDFPRTIDSAKAVLCGLAPADKVDITIAPPHEESLLPDFDGIKTEALVEALVRVECCHPPALCRYLRAVPAVESAAGGERGTDAPQA